MKARRRSLRAITVITENLSIETSGRSLRLCSRFARAILRHVYVYVCGWCTRQTDYETDPPPRVGPAASFKHRFVSTPVESPHPSVDDIYSETRNPLLLRMRRPR
ncbi:unnamed protein product [Lasius platythorax]|uniref:Uncharacterized protein n=1 Tax=Lasius platythorax TaxID=488582 RepID=A0AAV2NLQ9_9HYME